MPEKLGCGVRNRPKVCLIGAKLDSGNMGVSALAASLVNLIRRSCPDAEISLLISNRSSESQTLRLSDDVTISLGVNNYRMSPRSKVGEHALWIFVLACIYRIVCFRRVRKAISGSNRFLKSIEEADIIGDIRGGDSFSDIYGVGGLLVGSLPTIAALLMGKSVVMLPQTYGPYKHRASKWIARAILRKAKGILSRDQESMEVVGGLLGGIRSGEIDFCPDVAFTLAPLKPNAVEIVPALPGDRGAPIVGLNISGLLYLRDESKKDTFGLLMNYRRFVYELSLALLRNTNARLLFVPHTYFPPYASDTDASHRAISSLPQDYRSRIHLVNREYDQSEVKFIIGKCDFFVGSRMHACIAAISQGIPTIGVAYSKKFAGVFGAVGLEGNVLDARSCDEMQAVEFIVRKYQARDAVASSLAKVKAAQELTVRVFDRVVGQYVRA